MENSSEAALVNDLLGESHGRHTAVVIPDGVGHTRRFHRAHHGFGFPRVAAQWLLAHHHLPRLCRGNGDLGMSIVGAGDIDNIDVRRFNQLAPIGCEFLVSPVLREGRGARDALPGADCLQTPGGDGCRKNDSLARRRWSESVPMKP